MIDKVRSDLNHGKRLLIEGCVFVIAASVIAHLMYSWIGFNPTDEGYMLSASRRILDGQIPHRDYITLRPPGTHYLHAHLLLWAGDHLIWWSRFTTWFQLAVISWCWIVIAESLFVRFPKSWMRLCMAAIGLLGSASFFPIMPWNTIDGIFFISLGVLVSVLRPSLAGIGLFLIGTAPLFRQNFVFLLLPLVIVLGRWRSIASWLFVTAPGILYVLFLLLTHSFSDALIQMTSHKGSIVPVLLAPVGGFPTSSLQGAAIGVIAGALMVFRRDSLDKAACVLLGVSLVYAAFLTPLTGPGVSPSWFLFMIVLFALPFFLSRFPGARRFIFLLLVIGWGVSISEGCPQPLLVGGCLFLIVAGMILKLEEVSIFRTFVILTLVMLSYAVHRGRIQLPYCDLSTDRLNYALGEVMPGASNIRTSIDTYKFMKELVEITDHLRSEGRTYAVVPEAAQFWVTSPQPNPLSSDWPIDQEILDDRLRQRVLGEIDGLKGKASIVVQKFDAALIVGDRVPMESKAAMIIDRIRKDFHKVRETEFFDIYE